MTAPWWADTRAALAPALRDLRVAVYASGGAPYHHAALVAQWGGVPEMLGADEILAGALTAYDVLVVPGGGMNAMRGLLAPLGEAGAEQIQRWVDAGGLYVGSCAGAYVGAALPDAFLRANPDARGLQLLDAGVANLADGPLGGLASPGVGVFTARVTQGAHPLTRGLPGTFDIVHYNGPCFAPGACGVVTLQGVTPAFTPWERSLPGHISRVLADALLDQGAQLVVAGERGAGLVVLFGSHPEFGFSPLQLGWGEAARLFGNALAWQAERRASGGRPDPTAPATPGATPGAVADLLDRAAARFTAFRADPPDVRGAPAFLGVTPLALWSAALGEAAGRARDTAAYLRALAPQRPEAGPHARWVDHPPAPEQDYGFVGLRQLAGRIHALMDQADVHLRSPPLTPSFPYDQWDRSPYHLLASSYLSAAGLAASASLAAGTLGSLLGFDAPAPFPLTRSHHD